MGNRNARPEIVPGAENLPFMPNIGRNQGSMPSYVEYMLRTHGHVRIRNIKVVRTPIQTALRKVLGLLSWGAFESAVSEAGYDKLYHLDLWINDGIRLGKETNVRLDTNNPIVEGISEYMDVPLPAVFHDPNPWGGVNLSMFVNLTARYMGQDNFVGYNAKTNNCQDFVLAALTANGCNNNDVLEFVKQDAIQIFSGMPAYVTRWAGNITDLGEWVDSLIYRSPSYSRGGGYAEGYCSYSNPNPNPNQDRHYRYSSGVGTGVL